MQRQLEEVLQKQGKIGGPFRAEEEEGQKTFKECYIPYLQERDSIGRIIRPNMHEQPLFKSTMQFQNKNLREVSSTSSFSVLDMRKASDQNYVQQLRDKLTKKGDIIIPSHR